MQRAPGNLLPRIQPRKLNPFRVAHGPRRALPVPRKAGSYATQLRASDNTLRYGSCSAASGQRAISDHLQDESLSLSHYPTSRVSPVSRSANSGDNGGIESLDCV